MNSCGSPQFSTRANVNDSDKTSLKLLSETTMNKEKLVTKKPMKLESVGLFVLYCFDCFVSCVLAVLIIPILLLALVVLKFGKWLLVLYIKNKKNCIPLDEDDAVWQQDSPTNRHIIHALMILEGAPDMEKIKKIVSERMVYKKNDNGDRICARLTQAISECCGQFVWKEEEDFQIDQHVSLWDGENPRNKEELENVLSQLAPTPLPRNLSPWHFYIIPTKYERPSYAFLMRIHHSMGDGVGLTRVFVKNMYDAPPNGGEPRKFSTKQRLYMWCKAMLMGPMLVLTKMLTRADDSAVHGPELSGKKVIAWSDDVSLDLVKTVKNTTHTTVNDVMVACIAGAIHDYLKTHGPSKIEDMWASVPVDIRANNESLKACNKFALVFLRLPIVGSGCIERLKKAKQRMDIIKTSAEPLITATTCTMLMMIPEIISRTMIDFFSSKMSIVMSNIPGPPELLSIGGDVVYDGLFFPPARANMGVGLSIFSYGGKMRVGVIADTNVVSNPREITQGFIKHFNMLVNALDINSNKKNE